MINQKFIKERLELIQRYYQDLEKIIEIPMADFKKDLIRYYALERIFQLIVDEMIDINNHLISHNNFESPDDFQSTFIILAENDILPADFAKKIAPVVGLRNRLVHRYEKIEKDLAIKMIYQEKNDFKEYIKLLARYLNKTPETE